MKLCHRPLVFWQAKIFSESFPIFCQNKKQTTQICAYNNENHVLFDIFWSCYFYLSNLQLKLHFVFLHKFWCFFSLQLFQLNCFKKNNFDKSKTIGKKEISIRFSNKFNRKMKWKLITWDLLYFKNTWCSVLVWYLELRFLFCFLYIFHRNWLRYNAIDRCLDQHRQKKNYPKIRF